MRAAAAIKQQQAAGARTDGLRAGSASPSRQGAYDEEGSDMDEDAPRRCGSRGRGRPECVEMCGNVCGGGGGFEKAGLRRWE